MKISKARKSNTEGFKTYSCRKLQFGLKLLIFYSLGLFEPHKTRKMSLIVFLKFSPEKTDDFRFLQIEKITFQSRNMVFSRL